MRITIVAFQAVIFLLCIICSRSQNVNVLAYGVNTNNPFWDVSQQVVYFVDTDDRTQNRYNPATSAFDYLYFDQETTFIIPVDGGFPGQYFLGGLDRDAVFQYLDFDQGSYFNCLVATVDQCCPGNNFAAVKADEYGRIWACTNGALTIPDNYPPYLGSCYRIDTTQPLNPSVDRAISGLTNPAGLTWSPDNRRMYLTNYLSRSVLAYDFDLVVGTICNPRVVFSFDQANITGYPGGMTVDNYGNLWLAVTGGGQVINISPYTGELLYTITMPTTNVTAVEFGGFYLDTLIVTSQRFPGNDTESFAGYVFNVTDINVPDMNYLFGVPSNYAQLNTQCRPLYFSPSY